MPNKDKRNDGLETGVLTDEAMRRVIITIGYQNAKKVEFKELPALPEPK